MTSLKHKTISGIKWVMLTSVIQRVLSFGATIILARILTPADYGLFALAFVMIDGFAVFKSFGFDSAIVRRRDIDIEQAANNAFLLIPAIGVVLYAILFFAAPLGARFLNNQQLTLIIRVIGVVFVTSCLGRVPQTLLYRNMQFKFKTITEITAQFVYIVSAVALALNKFGVWSLVIAYVFKNVTQVSMEWRFSGWRPRLFLLKPQGIKLNFDPQLAKEMFHFGKYVLAGSVMAFLFTNIDNFMIGKLLGVTILGYYALAMSLANSLNGYFLGKVGAIMYPAYSQIQDNHKDVEKVMLKMLKYISIIAFPFCIGILIFAPDILRFLFGEKWLPAANVLRILSVVGLLRAIGSSIWPVFLAKGQPKTDFLMNAIQVGVFATLVIPLAIRFGLNGAATALLIATILSFSLGIIRIKNILGLKLIKLLETIKLTLISSLVMAVAAHLLKATAITSNIKLNLLLTAGVSAGTYIVVTYLYNRKIMEELRGAF